MITRFGGKPTGADRDISIRTVAPAARLCWPSAPMA